MIVSSPKSQHSQDKNLTPISQKKLAGIEITPSRAGSQTVGVKKKFLLTMLCFHYQLYIPLVTEFEVRTVSKSYDRILSC